MGQKAVFQCSHKSCKYIFKSGKEAHFVNGVYLTDIKSEVEELSAEIDAQHPHIFIDKDNLLVDTDQLDPLAAIKAKAVAEYLASLKDAKPDEVTQIAAAETKPDKPTREFGNSASIAEIKARLNYANSSTVNAGAADSMSGQVAS